jgi:plasmid stabilization system protein ParE
MRTVRIAESAEKELLERLDYIFQLNPQAAIKIYDRIEEALQKASVFPEMNRRSRYQKNRELFVAPLVIIYSIGEEEILIRHVFRQEEDWQNKITDSNER